MSRAPGPRPTVPRAVALDVARRVSRGAFLSQELGRALARSSLEGRDRSYVTDLVYGSVRHRLWLDAALAPRLRDPERLPEEVREALRLGAFEKLLRGTPAHAAVGEWVGVVRRRVPKLAGLVNAVLRRVEAPRDPGPALALSLPDWLWRRLGTALGAHAEPAVRAMHEPAPLWLTAYRDDAADRLRAEGCDVADGPLPGTLRVRPSRPLGELAAYREGLVQPQNPSSAWVAQVLGDVADERVLDLCSGRGVKAAQLAAAGARVRAFELSAPKLERARENLARLNVVAEHRQHDLRTPPPDTPPADRVLLDAPCSGTGTLRGHPEIVLRLRPEDLAALTTLQDELLDTAAALTAPGGTLAYAVCALTTDEGPERIDAFLTRHPTFEATAPSCPLPFVEAGAGVFVLPRDGLDGFFVARLTRRSRGGGTRGDPARVAVRRASGAADGALLPPGGEQRRLHDLAVR